MRWSCASGPEGNRSGPMPAASRTKTCGSLAVTDTTTAAKSTDEWVALVGLAGVLARNAVLFTEAPLVTLRLTQPLRSGIDTSSLHANGFGASDPWEQLWRAERHKLERSNGEL